MVAREYFDIEKNAKNQAYAFILACGLYDQFRDFCRALNHVEDWHAYAIFKLEQNKNI